MCRPARFDLVILGILKNQRQQKVSWTFFKMTTTIKGQHVETFQFILYAIALCLQSKKCADTFEALSTSLGLLP